MALVSPSLHRGVDSFTTEEREVTPRATVPRLRTMEPSTEPAARGVVRALVAAGVDHFFTVPGESFLAILDELRNEPTIRVVATRHEGGAAFMAEAYANLTRRPAACAGTRAVGAGNLAIGIHTADQNSTPLLALLGQVDSNARGRDAFQEADLATMLGTVSRWAVEPESPEALGESTYAAAQRAITGRQGPACIAYREDLLTQVVAPTAFPVLVADRPEPDPADLAAVASALSDAARPLLMVGVDVIASAATQRAVELAERAGLPVMSVWRRPDAFPNDHPHWVGQPGLSVLPCVRTALREADLWLVIGDRLDENTLAGYTLPPPGTRVIRVHLDDDADIRCGATEFLTNLLPLLPATTAVKAAERTTRIAALRARWEDESTPRPRPMGEIADGCVDQYVVSEVLRATLPPGTITVFDAGNFTGWPARYLRWNEPGTFLGPVSGAMGYAVPGAIGAKLARPDRAVVGIAGDGGFLMTANELATAVAENVDVTIIVMDNQEYGTIRMHQEREYPGRPVATALSGVDCAALARALGAHGLTVTSTADVEPALRTALAHPGPAVVHVRTDPRQLAVGRDDAPQTD